jgi:hypothetical protein
MITITMNANEYVAWTLVKGEPTGMRLLILGLLYDRGYNNLHVIEYRPGPGYEQIEINCKPKT